MTNSQAEAANNRIQVLEDRIKNFNLLSSRCLTEKESPFLVPIMSPHSPFYINLVTTITEFQLEIKTLRDAITTRQEWLFNFIGGGWNSVHAYTLEEAISLASIEHSGMAIIDTKSFRIATAGDEANLLSNFN